MGVKDIVEYSKPVSKYPWDGTRRAGYPVGSKGVVEGWGAFTQKEGEGRAKMFAYVGSR